MKTKKRILSMLVALCLLIGMLPQVAFATEGATIGTSGLCEHHTAHDETCGYVEEKAEIPCTHEHGEDCYAEITNCIHTHTEDCYPVMDSGVSGNEVSQPDTAEPICAHRCNTESGCITEEVNCPHADHNETCGYTPAVEGNPCHYECAECVEERKVTVDSTCTCESDDPTYHGPFCELYVPLENPECFCAEKCTGDLVNEWCDVCYFSREDCTGADTAAVYNTEDDMTNLYLGDIEIVSNGVINTSNGDGWSYDADTNTLTLNKYNYEGPGKKIDDNIGYAIIYAEGSLNLVLEGTNTMRMTSNNGGHGILLDLSEYHALNVSGSGSLDIIGNSISNSCGVKCGDFLMESGTLKVTQMYKGIESLRKFTMNGGTLDLDVSGIGIYCPDGVFRIEGGTYYCRCDNYAFQVGTDSRITGGSIISDMNLIDSITKLVPEGYVLSRSYMGAGYIFTVDKRYPIYAGGVGMEDGDYLPSGNNKTRADITKNMPGDSYAYYKDGKLTLHNYTYEGEGYYRGDPGISIGIYSDSPSLTICLDEGTSNTLTTTARGEAYTILTRNANGAGNQDLGDLVIEGTGTLSLFAQRQDDITGITCGSFTMIGGRLEIKGVRNGIYAREEIKISGTDTKITVSSREKAVYTDVLTSEGLNMAVQDCQSILLPEEAMTKTVEELQLGRLIQVICDSRGELADEVSIGVVHSWGDWEIEDIRHSRTCKNNQSHRETADHEFIGDSCVCGKEKPGSGGNTPTVPEEGGSNTPTVPAGGGSNTPTVPAGGGNNTPTVPAGGDDDTPTVPEEGGSNTPTVPEDGGDIPSDTPAESQSHTSAETKTVSATVVVSGDENSIQVGAEVSGTKATIEKIDLSALNTVIGDHVEIGVVTIDFSTLDKEIDTVEIPADVVKQITEAVNDPNNDAESLEIVFTDGISIEFDAKALGEKARQAGGLDITISIKHATDNILNSRQQQTIGSRPALDINVTSGGKHISDMGGKVSVHVPYELQTGEKAEGIVVFYVDDNGNREHCETTYDPVKKSVNWKTDHFSVYMIGYDESLEMAEQETVTEEITEEAETDEMDVPEETKAQNESFGTIFLILVILLGVLAGLWYFLIYKKKKDVEER